MFTFAFSLLAVRLVAECRRACELDVVTHGTEYDSIQAIKERSNVWRELKRVTEILTANDVSLFLRAGTWLAARRQAGYTPFDRDNDFAVLDSDIPRLKALTLPPPYKIVWKSSDTLFRLEPFVEGWPLVDGVVYKTNSTYGTMQDVSSSMKHLNIKFDLLDFQRFEELPFYTGFLRAPANSERYLKQMYGDDCLHVQVNKCARDAGFLFKTNPEKCLRPVYRGALDHPHMIHYKFVKGKVAKGKVVKGKATECIGVTVVKANGAIEAATYESIPVTITNWREGN